MAMNSEALFSRISEMAVEPRPRLDRLQEVAATLRQSAGYRWVGLYEVDAGRGEVRNLVWDEPAAPEYPTFPITKGLTSSAIAEKRTVNVADVGADPRYLTALGSTRSEIIVPILNDRGQVIGTIDVESEQPNAFDRSTERLLEKVCGSAALVVCGIAELNSAGRVRPSRTAVSREAENYCRRSIRA
jgi:L-methionine (R)-S-oxide reductase